ncbi:Ligand-gated chloride channel [Aphelenchoides fujianensis]|nr:Ligand-gated chloride channel [Aphelenchoides fujianensis]
MRRDDWPQFLLVLSFSLVLLVAAVRSEEATGEMQRGPRAAQCDNCDLRSSYCKDWGNGTHSCECRAGFTRHKLTGKCQMQGRVVGPRPVDDLQNPLLYGEEGETCILGEAEKHATRILTEILRKYDRNIVPFDQGSRRRCGAAHPEDHRDQRNPVVFSDGHPLHTSLLPLFFVLTLSLQIWQDPNLSYEHEEGAQCVTNLSLSYRMVDSIWVFRTSAWIMVESPCNFEFTTFPMDHVECTTIFESYSFNVGKVRLFWKRYGVPVEIIGEINLPDFILTQVPERQGKARKKITFNYPAGVWDQLSIKLYFRRSFGFYILQIFIPRRWTCFRFGCLGFIFLTIVELAIVGTLEKHGYRRADPQQRAEYFEPGTTTTAAGLARRAFQKTFADRSAARYRLRRVDSNNASVNGTGGSGGGGSGDGEWKKSTWAKLEDDSTFVECPQADPPSASTSNPETDRSEPPKSHALPPDSPTALARAFWKNTSIKRRGMVKVITPKLFSKWTGDDLDRFCQKLFPISFALANLIFWMYLTAKSQQA